MEYLIIALSALLASLLTFYSGFGLGTILMPVAALFVPLPLAIALTALVHLLHNLLKTALLWKAIDWQIVLRFGVAAAIASLPGALTLKALSGFDPLYTYSLFSVPAHISLLHIFIGLLLILFATLELFPQKIPKFKNLFLGGALSGFFGGLSGNQGAFRSAFLLHYSLSKESFIATNAVIASAVDSVRLGIYAISFSYLITPKGAPVLWAAAGGAMAGIFLGMLLLRKTTLSFIQTTIVCLLYLFGILLIAGLF